MSNLRANKTLLRRAADLKHPGNPESHGVSSCGEPFSIRAQRETANMLDSHMKFTGSIELLDWVLSRGRVP